MSAHDGALLDALSECDFIAFAGTVWRITRSGFDPLRGSIAQGRWHAGPEVEILYTSTTKGGALAEIGFRLGLEPIWPSRITHDLHTISVSTAKTLKLADLAALATFGIEGKQYLGFDYSQTNAIAAAAHFLEFDGLMVPSARGPFNNLVLFKERISELTVGVSENVDWVRWRGN